MRGSCGEHTCKELYSWVETEPSWSEPVGLEGESRPQVTLLSEVLLGLLAGKSHRKASNQESLLMWSIQSDLLGQRTRQREVREDLERQTKHLWHQYVLESKSNNSQNKISPLMASYCLQMASTVCKIKSKVLNMISKSFPNLSSSQFFCCELYLPQSMPLFVLCTLYLCSPL